MASRSSASYTDREGNIRNKSLLQMQETIRGRLNLSQYSDEERRALGRDVVGRAAGPRTEQQYWGIDFGGGEAGGGPRGGGTRGAGVTGDGTTTGQFASATPSPSSDTPDQATGDDVFADPGYRPVTSGTFFDPTEPLAGSVNRDDGRKPDFSVIGRIVEGATVADNANISQSFIDELAQLDEVDDHIDQRRILNILSKRSDLTPDERRIVAQGHLNLSKGVLNGRRGEERDRKADPRTVGIFHQPADELFPGFQTLDLLMFA